jgi:predicted O-methyltransferase YrrM
MRANMWGYGFHSVLIEYIHQNTCKKIMEIGVANGENACTMVRAAIRNSPPEDVEYYGFDLFRWNRRNHVRQKLKQMGCIIKLFKGDSVKTLPKLVKALPKMDLIFIDGGHDYATVKSDWDHAKTLMHNTTAVFFHNYEFSGPKRVVDNISRTRYRIEIIHPSLDCDTALALLARTT